MQAARHFRFGSFRLDTANACVWRRSRGIKLIPKAFAVLQHLVQNAGRLVTKEELLEAVWPATAVGDAVLKVCIAEIRKALDDPAATPRFVSTVHRRGYRFIAPVTEVTAPDRPRSARGPLRPAGPVAVPPAGRQTALSELHRGLERALGGERQVVFVTGEPGIGKTAVVEAFGADVAADPRVSIAQGQCMEHYGMGEAYLPVLEAIARLCRAPGGQRRMALLRRWAPTWLVQLPGLTRASVREGLQRELLGATRERMLREMAEALEALTAETPLVLVLEDLHWSDHATLDLVAALARRQEPARLLLIGTYRPGEVIAHDHPLNAVKAELELHGRCRELPLDLLSEAAVAQYLAARYPENLLPGDLARLIHGRTDGLPLFVITLVQELVGRGVLAEQDGRWTLRGGIEAAHVGIPASIRQMLEQQVERLSPDEQRVLEAASVAGAEFSAALVAAALGQEVVAVEAWCEGLARRQQILRPAEMAAWPDATAAARYGFRHTLYQDMLYTRVPAARQAQLHRRIGERLEAAYDPRAETIAAELAMHFERGGDAHRAVQYLRHAAENAIRRYANREAIGYLTRALVMRGRLPEDEQAHMHPALLEQVGLTRLAMGHMPAAAEAFDALAAWARNAGDAEAEAMALMHLTSALYWGDRERCLSIIDHALAVSGRIADGLQRAHVRGCCAFWNLELRGWRDEDARACAAAVEAARQAGDRVLLSVHLGRHAYFECLRSEYRASSRLAEEGLRLALDVGHAYYYLICQCYRARALLHLGEWGELLRVLDAALAMAEKNGHHLWTSHLRLLMAWLYEEAGAFEGARALCERELMRARQLEYGYGIRLSLILLGFAHLGLGHDDPAFDCFREAGQPEEHGGSSIDWILQMQLCHGLSEYWLARKELGRARQEAERLCVLAAGPGERTYLALGRRTLAEIAMAERRWDRAAAELSGALAVLEGTEAPSAAWRVYALAARLQRRRGHRAEADRYRRQSAAVLRRLETALDGAPELRQSLLIHHASISNPRRRRRR